MLSGYSPLNETQSNESEEADSYTSDIEENEVGQEQLKVIKCTEESDSLFTKGLAECLCIVITCSTEKNKYIAMYHTSGAEVVEDDIVDELYQNLSDIPKEVTEKGLLGIPKEKEEKAGILMAKDTYITFVLDAMEQIAQMDSLEKFSIDRIAIMGGQKKQEGKDESTSELRGLGFKSFFEKEEYIKEFSQKNTKVPLPKKYYYKACLNDINYGTDIKIRWDNDKNKFNIEHKRYDTNNFSYKDAEFSDNKEDVIVNFFLEDVEKEVTLSKDLSLEEKSDTTLNVILDKKYSASHPPQDKLISSLVNKEEHARLFSETDTIDDKKNESHKTQKKH